MAGTKGKGSTCAFIESLLRAHGARTGFPRKTGLYTSPHLIHPAERIRLNFAPISRDLFTKYFFEVHDTLSKNRRDTNTTLPIPRFLQLFLLTALHTFISEGVDAAILETHHGGEYDSTNVIEQPVVTVITPLGMDHVRQLGPTIQNIAWHKSGIFKPGTPAFSAPQESEAADVLRARAADKGVSLRFVERDDALSNDALQLKPDVQRENASLAVAVVWSFLEQEADPDGRSLTASDIAQGISQFSWPGRFQLVVQDHVHWFLDGAHNEMSVVKAAEWFLEVSDMQMKIAPAVRVLIFSQISEERDGAAVFECLAKSLAGGEVDYVIFTTYERGDTQGTDPQPEPISMRLLEDYSKIWKSIAPDTHIFFEPTIRGALMTTRKIGEERGSMHALITGSLYLVGGALSVLRT